MTAVAERGTTNGAVFAILRAREVGIALLIALVVVVTALHNHHFVDSNSVQ
jgi:hypothetical protein